MDDNIPSPQPLLRRSPSSRHHQFSTLLNRAVSRRGPPALVRETAAAQLDARRADWAYSRPVVAVDIAWNLSFAVVSASVIAAAACERPNAPIRVWIAVYALQCLLHVGLVWFEYRRRRGEEARGVGDEESGGEEAVAVDGGEESDDGGSGWGSRRRASFAKRCESLNTMASFLWWIVGFYWVISGGDALVQNAPKLYWLCVVFLAFDVCFAIFCVALALVIGIALCCCLPCIIAILYAIAGQEGASDADISLLPKYRYSASNDHMERKTGEVGIMTPITNNSESFPERVILREYAECCICLSCYEDGNELHALPCNHHFHSACITKWLKINATCPLCKYNILKSNDCV